MHSIEVESALGKSNHHEMNSNLDGNEITNQISISYVSKIALLKRILEVSQSKRSCWRGKNGCADGL